MMSTLIVYPFSFTVDWPQTVNAVAPALTRTEATEDVPAARHALYETGRALKRTQHPGDITGAVTFLLSDGAAFITGQTLAVNGGFVMH